MKISLCVLVAWFNAQLDPDIHAEILQGIASLKSFRVEFTQETYSDYFESTLAAGSLAIQRPGRMRLEYTRGERRLAICDGQVFTEYDYDAETLSQAQQEDLDTEPLVRIFLYGDDIEAFFLLDRYTGDDGVEHYRMRPRNRTSYTLEVDFDSAWRPRVLHVIGEEGDGTLFTFSHYEMKPEFATDTFEMPPDLKTLE